MNPFLPFSSLTTDYKNKRSVNTSSVPETIPLISPAVDAFHATTMTTAVKCCNAMTTVPPRSQCDLRFQKKKLKKNVVHVKCAKKCFALISAGQNETRYKFGMCENVWDTRFMVVRGPIQRHWQGVGVGVGVDVV